MRQAGSAYVAIARPSLVRLPFAAVVLLLAAEAAALPPIPPDLAPRFLDLVRPVQLDGALSGLVLEGIRIDRSTVTYSYARPALGCTIRLGSAEDFSRPTRGLGPAAIEVSCSPDASIAEVLAAQFAEGTTRDDRLGSLVRELGERPAAPPPNRPGELRSPFADPRGAAETAGATASGPLALFGAGAALLLGALALRFVRSAFAGLGGLERLCLGAVAVAGPAVGHWLYATVGQTPLHSVLAGLLGATALLVVFAGARLLASDRTAPWAAVAPVAVAAPVCALAGSLALAAAALGAACSALGYGALLRRRGRPALLLLLAGAALTGVLVGEAFGSAPAAWQLPPRAARAFAHGITHPAALVLMLTAAAGLFARRRELPAGTALAAAAAFAFALGAWGALGGELSNSVPLLAAAQVPLLALGAATAHEQFGRARLRGWRVALGLLVLHQHVVHALMTSRS